MNGKVVVDVPLQNDVAVLFGVFAGACMSAISVCVCEGGGGRTDDCKGSTREEFDKGFGRH